MHSVSKRLPENALLNEIDPNGNLLGEGQNADAAVAGTVQPVKKKELDLFGR